MSGSRRARGSRVARGKSLGAVIGTFVLLACASACAEASEGAHGSGSDEPELELKPPRGFRVPRLRGEQLALVALFDQLEGRTAGRDPSEDRRHVVSQALFPDGSFLWRVAQDGLWHYELASIDLRLAQQAVQTLASSCALIPNSERAHICFDSDFRSISLRGEGEPIELHSVHLSDPQSELVCSQYGMFRRNGRSNEELEREWSDDYRAFRSAWSRVVQTLELLQPVEGEPLDPVAIELRSFDEAETLWRAAE